MTQKSIEARNKLVESHLYLADILIRKFLGKGIEYDDLYQVASMALVSAADRFDESLGFAFSTFATPTILGEIKKYFRDKGWSVKMPRRLKENASAMQSVKESLTNRLGRSPNIAELAAEMKISEQDVLEAMEGSLAYSAYSLNKTFDEEGEEGENSIFEKYTAEKDNGYDGLEYREIIGSVLNNLSNTNRYIFKKRFIEEKSQAEIADMLGVSQMTVSRAEKKIKEKFAEELRK
jgi:RNA polymerase sigma-B factor